MRGVYLTARSFKSTCFDLQHSEVQYSLHSQNLIVQNKLLIMLA